MRDGCQAVELVLLQIDTQTEKLNGGTGGASGTQLEMMIMKDLTVASRRTNFEQILASG